MAAMPHRVLLADDDRAIRESLVRALNLEGYHVTEVTDGVHALATARRCDFDVLILDVTMPGVDGLGVCRVLRAEGDRTPILMLTARVETPDRVAGLDAGADDYLPKPFELDELLARLRALLRRTAPEPDARRTLRLGELAVDPGARRVWWQGTEITFAEQRLCTGTLVVRPVAGPVMSFQHSFIVSENGTATIRGNDSNEQAQQIVDRVAHPDARDDLRARGRELGFTLRG
ncbi:response regulator [Amycolatopsis sp. NPDC051128]|uniref:response regulator n=1 Tax=Amycolatopsis sp. NPDC051128 TaxID=3155412 RepID=UPI0034404225